MVSDSIRFAQRSSTALQWALFVENSPTAQLIEPLPEQTGTSKQEKEVLIWDDHQNWEFYMCSRQILIC